jgi:hypothetical protein
MYLKAKEEPEPVKSAAWAVDDEAKTIPNAAKALITE